MKKHDTPRAPDGVYRLTLPGRPVTKKNRPTYIQRKSRKTGRTYTTAIPEATYREWEAWLVAHCFAEHRGKLPNFNVPMVLEVTFWEHPVQRGDLFGYQDALADGLQAAGIIQNDRLIRATGRCQVLRDAEHPRIELSLEALI